MMIREYSEIPKYLTSILTVKTGFNNKLKIIGGDTESGKCLPLLLQFCNGDNVKVIEVDQDNVTDKFFEYLNDLPNGNYAIFFHNLEYDLVMLFYPYIKSLLNDTFEFCYIKGKWKIKIVYGKCHFATLKSSHKCIQILDSFKFFRSSLKNLGYMLKLKHKKLDSPKDIGDNRIITNELIKYAKQDARVQYDLSQYIIDQHKKLDIKPTVSIAQYSARIFKRHFIKNAIITLPPNDILKAAILSYHGGLNIFNAPMGMIRDVYELDINSAYPFAMSIIPNFNNCSYKFVDDLDPDREGIYKISGIAKTTKYPILFEHDFRHISGESIKDIWITSYELKEAMRTNDLKIEKIRGIVIEEKENQYNPFKEFVKSFYKLKVNTPKSDPNYHYWKLTLNSIYGKLIQGIPIDNISSRCHLDRKTDVITSLPIRYKAGGLFNPLIASLITGYIRAMLRAYALKYKALDTSTDSIKTTIKPKTKDLGKELGAWSIDNFGDCLFLRNKLYIHYGEHTKSGLHGFRGTTEQLRKMWENKQNEYTHIRMMKLKESYIRKDNTLMPLSFNKETSHLNLFHE